MSAVAKKPSARSKKTAANGAPPITEKVQRMLAGTDPEWNAHTARLALNDQQVRAEYPALRNVRAAGDRKRAPSMFELFAEAAAGGEDGNAFNMAFGALHALAADLQVLSDLLLSDDDEHATCNAHQVAGYVWRCSLRAQACAQIASRKHAQECADKQATAVGS